MKLDKPLTKKEFKSFWRHGGLRNIKIADPDIDILQEEERKSPEKKLWRAVLARLVEDLFSHPDTLENYEATRFVLNAKDRKHYKRMLERALMPGESSKRARRRLHEKAKNNERWHNMRAREEL